jgi:hypothetical protein
VVVFLKRKLEIFLNVAKEQKYSIYTMTQKSENLTNLQVQQKLDTVLKCLATVTKHYLPI